MDTKFQSRTFKFVLGGQENLNDFKKDIEVIKKIYPRNLEILIEHAIHFVFADIKKKEQEIVNGAVELKLIDNEEMFWAISRVVRLFCEIFIHEKTKGDNISEILKDLSNELNIDTSELNTIKSLIEISKNKSDYYKRLKYRKKSEVGVLPYLKGFDTTVELRGIFSKEFGLGDDRDLYIREVKIEEITIPIISINIRFDSGNPDKVFFQASPEDLNLLINELKVAVDKAKILQKKFNS